MITEDLSLASVAAVATSYYLCTAGDIREIAGQYRQLHLLGFGDVFGSFEDYHCPSKYVMRMPQASLN